MSPRAPQPSAGERVVYCTRGDCAHAGGLVPIRMLPEPEEPGPHYYACLADCIVLDRREQFGKPIAAFAKRGVAR